MPKRKRKWDDYVARTARYAFGGAGDRQMERVAKYEKQWYALGREPVRQQVREQKLERGQGLSL